MRKKIPPFSKLAFSIFIAIFTLCFISLSGSNGFLKPSIAEAADSVVGLTRDNPGIRMAIEVQSRHSERLMGMPGIVGHGIGISSDGEPVIKIFTIRAGIPNIPAVLEGVPTKVKVTGMVFAYADRTARFPRPVPIGVSTGHPDITAGTIGCRVKDVSGKVYALSNNHIYANENDATIGVDSALQPGDFDGGVDPDDAIGTLYDFKPIVFDVNACDLNLGALDPDCNIMDAAIAAVDFDDFDKDGTSEWGVGVSTPSDDGYGTPSTTTIEAFSGLNVQKYGRTTGLTLGTVDTIDTFVDVCYDLSCSKEARFIDQISITSGTFSDGGDSGSLIVTDDGNRNPVGLLFAGSNTHTFANRIAPVLDQFGVTVDNCPSTCTDSDDDGYYLEVDDCDDADPSINPGATETCYDAMDNDCDDLTDCEDSDCESDVTCCTDLDQDGYCSEVDDCDDLDPSINPDACDIKRDGIDQDCDGQDRTTGRPCVSDDSEEIKEKDCSDGIDNDGDGLFDCADPDCSTDVFCACDLGLKGDACEINEDCCSGDCHRIKLTCK